MIKGWHCAAGKLVSSSGETIMGSNPLDVLLARAAEINLTYHLNYFVANLVRMMNLTPEQGKEFIKGRLTFQGQKIRYAPGKYLAIGRTVFADAFQYHEEELWRQSPDENHLDLARRACEIGGEVYSALTSIGLHPTKLTSPIGAFQAEVLSRGDFPTVDDMPSQVGEMAYECCKGSWLECYKIGHFPQTFDYDICSAYPSEIYNLTDIRNGLWLRSSKYASESVYGFARGLVTVNSDISPMLYAKGRCRGDRQNFTPTGSWNETLTKQQIDYLHETGEGTFEIRDAFWFIPEGRQSYPYRSLIEKLFEHKEKNTGLRRTVIKRIPNGLYGKMLEIHVEDDGSEKMGDLFNPVYGAITETNTRLKDARFVKSQGLENNLLHVAVDGLLLDTEVTSGLSDDLGGWRESNRGAAYVVGAGAVALEGKEGRGDFSLSYNWLKNQIAENPDATDYVMSKPAPITLPLAISSNQWAKLGTLQPAQRAIGLTYESKRLFPEMPACGADLQNKVYNSLPLDVLMC